MATPRLQVLQRPVEFAQYLAIRYTERLAEAGGVRSVGSKGDSYDNALAESFNGLYKTELIHKQRPWFGLEDVEHATLGYADWFNTRRLHGEIGMVPPVEFEAAYIAVHPSKTTTASRAAGAAEIHAAVTRSAARSETLAPPNTSLIAPPKAAGEILHPLP